MKAQGKPGSFFALPHASNGIRMKLVVTLALILTFSPGEKEQRPHLSGFGNNRPTNPVADFCMRRQVILPLLGGEGRGEGERETFVNATRLAKTRLVALESDLPPP